MEIRFLHVKLVKVRTEHLELIREWRNTEEVRDHMIYREYITPQQQQRWFENMQNENNFFFVIFDSDIPVGLIDIKHVNWDEQSADSGIFIAPRSARNSNIPFFASVMSATFMTRVLNIRKLYGKVLEENRPAVAFNLANGFVVTEKKDGIVYMCVPETAVAFPGIIAQKSKLCRLYNVPETSPVQLLITEQDIDRDAATRWLTQHRIIPEYPAFIPGNQLDIL